MRNNPKKIAVVLVFAMMLCSTISFPAMAAEEEYCVATEMDLTVSTGLDVCPLNQFMNELNYATEIRDADAGFIDPNVENRILKSIHISAPAEKAVTYTVKKMGKVYDRSISCGDLYTLTATSKTKVTSDTTDQDNVHAYLSITWIDNLGVNNELVSVQGGWSTERSLYDRTVMFGVDDYTRTEYPTSNSFSYPNIGLNGYRMHAVSTVQSRGYKPVISVMIATDVLD